MNSWPGKPAGAPPPVAAAPADSIAARVMERRRELTTGPVGTVKIKEEVADAMADAIVAAEETMKGEVGGKRKTRGGAETADALKEVVRDIIGRGPVAIGAVDKALGAVIRATPTTLKLGTAVSGVAVALNHPTLFGNLAQLSAQVLKTATDTTIKATWGDWGEAILGVGKAIGVIGTTIASQTVQGPVVPVAIATAIMVWRAGQAGKTVGQIIKDDAEMVAQTVATTALGQVSAFQKGVVEGNMGNLTSQLKELANIAKKAAANAKAGVGGPGVVPLSMSARRTGAPAAQSTFEGAPAALVPGSATAIAGNYEKALTSLTESPGTVISDATKREFADARAQTRAMAARKRAAVAEDGEGTDAEYAADNEEESGDDAMAAPSSSAAASAAAAPDPDPKPGDKRRRGSGRKTAKKAKKSKRRATRRARRSRKTKVYPSTKMPVFAY
jgi:hypothetical protein